MIYEFDRYHKGKLMAEGAKVKIEFLMQMVLELSDE